MRCARIGGQTFAWGSRAYVMGVVNVTPDSFSGDGLTDAAAAVEHGLRLAAAGADILDVGGESTRPGHQPVSVEEEIARAVPVVEELVRRSGVPVSIDTYKLPVAEAAVNVGATILNDVWGLQRDAGLAGLAARTGAAIVLMHNQDGTVYADLVADVVRTLAGSAARAVAAGVDPAAVIVDPGIGFGKTPEQNVEILRHLDALLEIGHPILVGTSRKSFHGRVFGLEGEARVWGTAASVTAAILRGADVVRVHDVEVMAAVSRVAFGLR